jgi:hypothetical protein
MVGMDRPVGSTLLTCTAHTCHPAHSPVSELRVATADLAARALGDGVRRNTGHLCKHSTPTDASSHAPPALSLSPTRLVAAPSSPPWDVGAGWKRDHRAHPVHEKPHRTPHINPIHLTWRSLHG